MSQGCAVLILRSRSWSVVYCKWCLDYNWLCNQAMIMKLCTLTPNESRMRPIDFEVQRSRSWRMINCKWFPDYNWLCNPPMIMKLHTSAPYKSRMCLIDFGVKGHGLFQIEISQGCSMFIQWVLQLGFLCPRIEWSGAYCFCPVCLLSTLIFAMTFEP